MKSYPATIVLIVLLLIYFAYEILTGAIGNNISLLRLGALPDSGDLQGQYWRLFTHSVLHDGYLHLLLNITLLGFTGRIVERRVGGYLMIGVYVCSVVLGGLCIFWWKSLHPTVSVTLGASGGVFGLLSASLVLLYRPAAVSYKYNPRVRRLLWLILGVGITISLIPGVSFVGHFGGLASGAILGLIIPVQTVREKPKHDDDHQSTA